MVVVVEGGECGDGGSGVSGGSGRFGLLQHVEAQANCTHTGCAKHSEVFNHSSYNDLRIS